LGNGYSTALGASRVLLNLFRVLNLIAGALLVICFVASFLLEPAFRDFFAKQPARIDPRLLIPVLRVWMLLTVPVIVAVDLSLRRLLEMVATVRAGDPFVARNAARLRTIAWCTLWLELYGLLCGLMAAIMNAAGSNISWSLSLTGWLAVALMFVLARVFEEGTRLRDDLEAMV
jgi:hypothetical protein